MDNILNLTEEELKNFMKENKEKSFRATQVYKWIYKGIHNFDNMSNLSQSTKILLNDNFYVEVPDIITKQESEKKDTFKYLLKYKDGNMIECVLMKYAHGNSLCVSTQVGCNMGCKFCASTIEGKVRDLTDGEMLGEILVVQKDLNLKISHVVLMGSGEPLDNYNNVIRFIKRINDKNGLNIGQRHITLSTCGIVPKIKDLADENLQITLAISLHATNDEKRKQIMPITNKYGIKEILNECIYYIKKTGRRISFEYSLVKGINDKEEDAENLSKLLKDILCHVNLIPINEIKETNFKKSNNAERFLKILEKNNIPVTIRREMGSDIDAACGQLRRKYKINKD